MREIKFRAWDVGFSKIRSWENIKKNCNWNIFNSECFIPEQFTGLHDKNGREIYENDIIKSGQWILPVIFTDGCFTAGGIELYILDELEIIGNIHENSNLMEAVS